MLLVRAIALSYQAGENDRGGKNRSVNLCFLYAGNFNFTSVASLAGIIGIASVIEQ